MTNCELFRERLDDFVEGALSNAEATALEGHAVACDDCAAELRRLQAILDLVGQLPSRVEPSADLWPSIAARLDVKATVERGRFRRGMGSWLAAAAVVAAAVGSVLMAYTLGRHQAETVVVERSVTPSVVPARAGDWSMAAVEVEFQEAREELLAALEQRQGQLSPETLGVVQDNLRVIDAAIGRISEALGEDPGNPMLTGQLTRAYQQQVELLQRANRLPAEI